MTLKISKDSKSYTLYDVSEVFHCDCELAIKFNTHHRYHTMEEILENLPPCENLNFIFKGVYASSYKQNEAESYKAGRTSLLMMIYETEVIVGD